MNLTPLRRDITDPETVRRVYSAGTGFNKSDYYSVFKGASTWNLFAEQDEEVHGRQRRAVARVYSIAYLKELESYVNTVIEDISNSFQKLGPTGLDFSPWAGFFAYGSLLASRASSYKIADTY